MLKRALWGVGHTQWTMTEQEAEVLAKRLERIWGVFRKELHWEPANEFHDGVYFGFVAFTPEFELIYYDTEGKISVMLESGSAPLELGCREGQISRYYTCSPGENYDESGELLRQFVTRWIPFFRRGCWLSGCPLEASAHEKAEWMQGFSREEIDAWNLKF